MTDSPRRGPLDGLVVAAAAVSLVPVGAAAGAGSADETIGKKHAFSFVVGLTYRPGREMIAGFERLVDVFDEFPVLR